MPENLKIEKPVAMFIELFLYIYIETEKLDQIAFFEPKNDEKCFDKIALIDRIEPSKKIILFFKKAVCSSS